MVANPTENSETPAGNEVPGLEAMKSIMVALDGSAPSMAALKEAVEWAVRLNAELRAVFVEDERRFIYYPAAAAFEGGLATPAPLPEDRIETENEKVGTEAEAIRRSFEEVVAERVPVASMTTPRGNVNDVLIAEARAADLTVMGKRGRNDPPDSEKPGPTTEALIHDALRPVLVVPEKGRTEGGVLLAFDGSISAQRVLVPGTHLAKALGRGMTVLTVDPDERKGRAIQSQVIKYCKSHGVNPVHQVARGKPAVEIVEAARAYDSGLIVMGAFGHGAIRQLVFGSATLTVLEKAPCPVLLMA